MITNELFHEVRKEIPAIGDNVRIKMSELPVNWFLPHQMRCIPIRWIPSHVQYIRVVNDSSPEVEQ